MVSGYIAAGCMFTFYFENWGILDSIYFWVVTFTTVGLGDVLMSEKYQLHEYMAPLVVYRTFGLALLAGFIDSLAAWVHVWKSTIQSRRANHEPLCCPSCYSNQRKLLCCGLRDRHETNGIHHVVEPASPFIEDEHYELCEPKYFDGE